MAVLRQLVHIFQQILNEVFAGNGQAVLVSVTAVSYTHLDVYKRQVHVAVLQEGRHR